MSLGKKRKIDCVFVNEWSERNNQNLASYYYHKGIQYPRYETIEHCDPESINVYSSEYLTNLFHSNPPGFKAIQFLEQCKNLAQYIKGSFHTEHVSISMCSFCIYYEVLFLLIYATSGDIPLPLFSCLSFRHIEENYLPSHDKDVKKEKLQNDRINFDAELKVALKNGTLNWNEKYNRDGNLYLYFHTSNGLSYLFSGKRQHYTLILKCKCIEHQICCNLEINFQLDLLIVHLRKSFQEFFSKLNLLIFDIYDLILDYLFIRLHDLT